jgi:hypothetical protein
MPAYDALGVGFHGLCAQDSRNAGSRALGKTSWFGGDSPMPLKPLDAPGHGNILAHGIERALVTRCRNQAAQAMDC